MMTEDDLGDSQLAASFLNGDEAAFRALYRRHTPALYALAYRVAGADGAADVLQETWIRASRLLPRFRWESKLRTWLHAILINCAREFLRAASHEVGENSLLDAASVPAPDGDARVDLERAIANLSLRYREVFLLHDVERYTHAEIGSMLGIDEGTSKSNLSRARAALRVSLGNVPSDRRHI